MKKELNFKISAALKNIIGRDLINDDFIAVFELVKNSYDAHASEVEIRFEKKGEDFTKIVISDNGKGMNYDDINKKWLFVAYSAKKEGTEEDSYNYRDKIDTKRSYAGAKGIGRFSCDRLGSVLYMETIKDEDNSKIESLLTDWEKFEDDLNDEFVNINVIHETLKTSSYGKNKGTVLEISNLRSHWDREKLLNLKIALAKLINPNVKESNLFKITLNVESELLKDAETIKIGQKKNLTTEATYRKIVNGEIKNFIFKTLELKTTKIVCNVLSNEEDKIETCLYEGGKLVYKIVEQNSFINLQNVTYKIYYLNQSAKKSFTQRMGIQPVNYGHVFVYKNGLRIYPYGKRGEDPLKMDNRKAQGRTRYLGTREVIGFIEIQGENPNLMETSSRGDGLIKTEAYFQLYSLFYVTLRRLEKYIVDVSDWGKDLSEDDYINLNQSEKVLALKGLVEKLTKTKNIISIEYADDLFELLEEKEENSTIKILEDIKNKINDNNYDRSEIIKSVRKVESHVKELKKSKDESELETEVFREEVIKLESKIALEKKKNLWIDSIASIDQQGMLGMQHQIFHSSGRISRNLNLLINKIKGKEEFEELKKFISIISLENSKINSITKFITKANFNVNATTIFEDLIDFMSGYIKSIYLGKDNIIDVNLDIKILNKLDYPYVIKFIPLEVTTLIDNFINNSIKASSTKMSFIFYKDEKDIIIEVEDNGINYIGSELYDSIFDLGYTTTSGSGIGLYQVKKTVENLKGNIFVESIKNKGTIFKIKLPNEDRV